MFEEMLDTIKGIQACQPHSGTPTTVPSGSRQTLWRAQSVRLGSLLYMAERTVGS